MNEQQLIDLKRAVSLGNFDYGVVPTEFVKKCIAAVNAATPEEIKDALIKHLETYL